METILLNNGKTLPLEGFGVFQITEQTLCQQAVLEALQEGYRLIDTAASYFNEEAVGRALRTSGLPRTRSLSPPKCGCRILEKSKHGTPFCAP